MQLLSPSKPQLPLFQPLSRNPSPPSRPFNIPFNLQSQALLRTPPWSAVQSVRQCEDEELEPGSEKFNDILVVRRPAKVPSSLSEEVGSLLDTDDDEEEQKEEDSSPGIEDGLDKFAKKMPIFEPLERVVVVPEERPLAVNLELALYKAKVLGQKFQYRKAEKILRRCVMYWPEDGRAYVALGKIQCKQSKYNEARVVYETGCQAARGENPYIWQCWAVLENKLGNVRRARELFDAATVADNKHVAAWHGWATLEIKEGNIKKARNLLAKGLKYCGANEYIYQTLALLEAKANRIEQARYLFQRATACNPKSCASWLAWAQLEMRREKPFFARKLFEKSVQASPKNRFAWHVWAMFEASQGDVDKAKKLLKIGHAANPRDPVLLQSMALLEYRHSSANFARVLFNRASEIDPKHQPVWMAWGWIEWKEGNISKARELYQRVLSIDSTTETAARCLQAWGVLEQRLGNLTAARRLFRSSLNINSQSYITWMTWASLEEEQGNDVRAEEIRNLYFQQRTEIVDDDSWVMGFLDIIDPAVDGIRRLLKLDHSSELKEEDIVNLQGLGHRSVQGIIEPEQEQSKEPIQKPSLPSSSYEEHDDDSRDEEAIEEIDRSYKVEPTIPVAEFNLDAFIRDKLSINPSNLDAVLDFGDSKRTSPVRRTWNPKRRTIPVQA